jgi:hypothetical protein
MSSDSSPDLIFITLTLISLALGWELGKIITDVIPEKLQETIKFGKESNTHFG